jgi:hypothetical protein
MGGIVIAFPGVRGSSQRRKEYLPRSRSRRPQLMMQIERITALLEELKDISDRSSKLPPAMLASTRTSIRKAERILGLRDDVAHGRSPILEQESDPQPHVDREVLERFFYSQDQYQ